MQAAFAVGTAAVALGAGVLVFVQCSGETPMNFLRKWFPFITPSRPKSPADSRADGRDEAEASDEDVIVSSPCSCSFTLVAS